MPPPRSDLDGWLAATRRVGLERFPRVALPLRALQHRVSGRAEPELSLLRWLVPRDRDALDIGANRGTYTWPLSRLARHTWAVEANPEHLAVLRGIHPRKVSVLNVAASDHAGTLALHIPTAVEGPSGLATVEHNPRWQTSRVEAVPVPAARLDEILANEVIGFIKVDVEGHELSALKGAEGILARHAPALLIEAEERHRQDAVASVSNFLAGFGYVGMMLVKGTLTSIDQFDPRTHQRIDDVQALDRGEVPEGYVNNFIFLGGR